MVEIVYGILGLILVWGLVFDIGCVLAKAIRNRKWE
jgi:hypothetical protein